MPKIRVLIVDDSVVVRSRVSKVLADDPDLEVVGVAANGQIALAKIPQVNPDAIVLDVEMPEMNGLETLAAIRRSYPRLPVIMFSTFTRTGATATLDALALGANDYATKPSNLGSVEAANQHICTDLIPKIKLFGLQTATRSNFPVSVPKTIAPPKRSQGIDAIAIGVSTGGPNALAELLPQLPADLSVPLLIVQHMPPLFTKLMAERLASKCKIRVEEAVAGVAIEPGQAWIAPGNFHLVVKRERNIVRLAIHQAPPENSCRPSVDVLFASLAQVYQNRAMAIVLTGMGQDGLRGCQYIREAGGQILVQDKDSSVVWGMPGAIVDAGLADGVFPLHQMADEIIRKLSNNT
jgi:two-component system, chemotaxis family, protein-glutamate methylesterase/glutaminase